MRQFKGDTGFLTFAIGSTYLRAAYAQALSIACSQQHKNFAVIVDTETNNSMPDHYRSAFTEIVVINHTQVNDWDMTQTWKAYALSPWKETILVDADMLFCQSIDHWWPALRQRDVCLTTIVTDFQEVPIKSRAHRKLFDINLLPDVYGGFVYFRYTQFTAEFFLLLRNLTANWEWVAKEHLIKNTDYRVRVDELFAIASRIVGVENVTLPVPLPSFVHGKEELWKLSNTVPWHEQLYLNWDKHVPVIGMIPQRLPLHYHHKDWLTDDIIARLEKYART